MPQENREGIRAGYSIVGLEHSWRLSGAGQGTLGRSVIISCPVAVRIKAVLAADSKPSVRGLIIKFSCLKGHGRPGYLWGESHRKYAWLGSQWTLTLRLNTISMNHYPLRCFLVLKYVKMTPSFGLRPSRQASLGS